MQRFKKRLRLLAEKLGGTLAYDQDGSLRLRFNTGSARFSSLSYDAMHCEIELGDAAFPIRAPKEFVFDIADRLAAPHLAPKLRSYTRGSLLTLQDYIDDEHGGPCIESLRKRLVDDPSLVQANLGGNRIFAEYYRGVLILCDDLCRDATNVVDFSPHISR
jgi:hypothetical protein